MNIKVSDLKKFKTYSSHVEGNGVLPIQNCLKFGKGMIQKEVTSSFIKFDCPEAKEEILVDEKVLYCLVNATASDVISITHKNGKTIISDKLDTIPMPVPEVSLFVDIATEDMEKIPLSSEFLDALGSAARVCNAMGNIPDKYMYVMVGNKCVTGISISYGYCRIIEEDVVMSLEKKTAIFLSRSNASACSVTESHYIFYTESATIGFAKHVIGYGDFGKSLRADPGELTFTASNSDIQSFNSLAISLAPNPEVTLTTKGTLEMYDSEKEISQDRSINIKALEDFRYLPSYMNSVLSALGDEELDFYQKPNMLIIKSKDTNATAAIGKIQKLNNK